MNIDFKRLNTILEAKAGRAIDRLDSLKCYTTEFAETLNSILFMLESSKELEEYDTECQDCKQRKEENNNRPETLDIVGQSYIGQDGLVLFYSEHCQPCSYFKPIVEQYAHDYNIPFELILVDTNDGVDKARQYGVQGWPTLFAIKNQTVNHVMVGADMNAPVEMTRHRIDNELGKFVR